MTIPAAEPDPHARGRAGDSAAALDAAVGGDERAAPRRGEARLLLAPERDDPGAVPGVGLPAAAGASSSGPARRLRLAPPVQLELVSGREGPRPEVVWASLPGRARETVLVLLARLIGTGTVEEQEIEEEGV